MKNEIIEDRPTTDKNGLERWLGRREAFGIIAGRCSAADIECLREIRNQKLYLESAKNWGEFCQTQLRTSRRRSIPSSGSSKNMADRSFTRHRCCGSLKPSTVP